MSTDTLTSTTKLRKVAEGLAASHAQDTAAASARSIAAREALMDLEFPTTKAEAWKYTRTGLIANKAWKFSGEAAFTELPIDLEDMPQRLVFVNGHFSAAYSAIPQIEALSVLPFSEKEKEVNNPFDNYTQHTREAFAALNVAYPQDGVAIHLAKNTAVDEPLYLVNIYSGEEAASQPRNTIHLERGSSLKITEFHIHTGSTFANTASEIRVDDNAHLGIDTIQMGSAESFHVQEVNTIMGRDAVFTHNNFTLSGKWTRNNTNARIIGEGSTCNMHGFYMPNGRELVDNHTIMDHEVPHCDSNELYRGVLLDQATGVFNGKVFVRQDAQKTNAFQSNGNILVSDQATMNSKPELEIYADDVKCSHGSTTGQLDDAAMFYLRARGLSANSARRMLVTAFAADVLDKMVNQNMRSLVETNIEERLK
jgi:Fe-S cluster assembly protein SufD